jgi:hypothetical protein
MSRGGIPYSAAFGFRASLKLSFFSSHPEVKMEKKVRRIPQRSRAATKEF